MYLNSFLAGPYKFNFAAALSSAWLPLRYAVDSNIPEEFGFQDLLLESTYS